MNKYHYITLIAVCAILLLQVIYVMSLYNRYVDENVTKIDVALRISIDKEQHLRSVYKEGRKSKEQQYLSIKNTEDMSPQEIDSLKHLFPIPEEKENYYSIDAAREKGIASTSSELVSQIMQDWLFEKGYPLDLYVLDSIFNSTINGNFRHFILFFRYSLLLCNKDKEVTALVGELDSDGPNYTSAFFPIGTKGLQYLKIKAEIPLLPFIEQQVLPLLLSVLLMLFVVFCMAYHLIVIRRKDALLQRREKTINGTIHDLKAPLNSAVTTLGWLESGEANFAKKRALEISKAEVKHLVCNIESLLVTVRKDRKRLVLKKEDVDILHLAEIVKSNMDVLYSTKPHSIEVVNELPEGVRVSADGMYIENVIRNLVENALKYSDDGVKVEVVLSVVGNRLQVSVQDNGWGINPAYQKKLFQQFYQVPREEKRIRKGYGIGLTQSKYIIDEHEGKITVNSAEGRGSVFTFTIPLV